MFLVDFPTIETHLRPEKTSIHTLKFEASYVLASSLKRDLFFNFIVSSCITQKPSTKRRSTTVPGVGEISSLVPGVQEIHGSG